MVIGGHEGYHEVFSFPHPFFSQFLHLDPPNSQMFLFHPADLIREATRGYAQLKKAGLSKWPTKKQIFNGGRIHQCRDESYLYLKVLFFI